MVGMPMLLKIVSVVNEDQSLVVQSANATPGYCLLSLSFKRKNNATP